MKKIKTAIWMVVFATILCVAGVVSAADSIPFGDYEVLSANDTQTEFVLAFTGDYRWHVRALCIQPEILPPSVGSLCSYNGEVFTCPGAQSLSLLEILQQPPTPTVPSATPTATATFTPTQTFTPTPTFTPLPSATTTPTATITQIASQPATVVPSWTPVLPGAPASDDLLATITAANQAFQPPEVQVPRSLVGWIKWLFMHFWSLFGK